MSEHPKLGMKVVHSGSTPGQYSLRGLLENGPVQDHLKKAGFEPGDEVVILKQSDYMELKEMAGWPW